MMKKMVDEICDELCVQLRNKELQNALYETVVKPLVLHTAYKLKVPLIIIIVILIIFIILLVNIWWKMSFN